MPPLITPAITISPDPVAREDLFRGMKPVDLSGNRKIPILMEMVGALSRTTEPLQVQRVFAEGMFKMHGPRGYVSLSTRGLPAGQFKVTRMMSVDRITAVQSDPWREWSRLPAHAGGFFGALIRHPVPALIRHLQIKDDPAVGNTLAQYRSLMAVPLFDNGEPLNWSIQLDEDPEGFTVEELEDNILRANLGGATVRNTMITKQLREANEKIRAEVEQIGKIQRALLPQSLPHMPGLSIATSYESYDTAGGDLYDLTILEPPAEGPTKLDGNLAMVIADASGHGPAAAVLTAMLNTLLHAYPRRGEGPGAVFDYANCHLHAKRIEGTFVTAFRAVYDPRDRTLRYANAGHNPPLIKTAGEGGAVRRLDDVGGIPLGVLEDTTYETGMMQLERGQTLVLYTDGITEAMNPEREMFGVEGIEVALHACSGEPACVIQSITTALREHEAGVRPSDDQTIVAMKVE